MIGPNYRLTGIRIFKSWAVGVTIVGSGLDWHAFLAYRVRWRGYPSPFSTTRPLHVPGARLRTKKWISKRQGKKQTKASMTQTVNKHTTAAQKRVPRNTDVST